MFTLIIFVILLIITFIYKVKTHHYADFLSQICNTRAKLPSSQTRSTPALVPQPFSIWTNYCYKVIDGFLWLVRSNQSEFRKHCNIKINPPLVVLGVYTGCYIKHEFIVTWLGDRNGKVLSRLGIRPIGDLV